MELVALSLLAGIVCAPAASQAAVFSCSGGDVGCLIDAINAANANGQVNTIRLEDGAYTLRALDNTADGPNGLPSVTSTLMVTGVDAAMTTVERAADAPPFRIFHVGTAGVLTLRRITIRGGFFPVGSRQSGAGVLSKGILHVSDSVITGNATSPRELTPGGGIAGSTVTLTRTTIRGNSGGGILVTGGDLTIRNSTIADNNRAFRSPGGIAFVSAGRLTIVDTTITGNLAVEGPGLGIYGGGVAVIRDSTISRNHEGGVHICCGTTVDIDHSAIVDNREGPTPFVHAAGIMVVSATLTVHESTIARNVVPTYGFGALLGAAGDHGGRGLITVTGSTITDNVAANPFSQVVGMIYGAGIGGDVRLENTIVARNKGFIAGRDPSGVSILGELNCYGPITSLGHNLISDPTRCGDLQSSDTVGDPGLGNFIDPGRPGTAHYPLLDGSLAIDAGSNDACARRDQQGLVRGIDGNGDGIHGCDLGAIEFYPVVNESVRLDRVRATFVPADPAARVNPLAAGGRYEIDAAFTNIGGQTICQVAFDVATLEAASGIASVLTREGQLIGGEGIQFPATLVSGDRNLQPNGRQRYRFTIGVTEPVPLTFFVDVLGERTPGRCSPPSVSPGESDAAIPPSD